MIFLDSSFLIGFFIKNDDYHEKAHELKDVVSRCKVLINTTVLNEVMNSFKHVRGYPVNFDVNLDVLFNHLIDEATFHHLSKNDYISAYKFYKHLGGSINYSDCTIVMSMIANGVTEVVSFDSDFDKIKGFRRIYL